MTILWVIRHAGYVRNYDAALRALADRGHAVHLLIESGRDKMGEEVPAERLARACPNVTFGAAPSRTSTFGTVCAEAVRSMQDFARLDVRLVFATTRCGTAASKIIGPRLRSCATRDSASSGLAFPRWPPSTGPASSISRRWPARTRRSRCTA